MKLALIRHAKATAAAAAGEEDGGDLLRALSGAGHRQAEAVGALLERELEAGEVSRVVSAPALRCQQTVEPFAVARDLPIDVDERLAKAESLPRLLELLPAVEEGTVVFCTHQRLITGLLQLFELGDGAPGAPPPARKGSVWLLEGRGATPTQARYFEPVQRPASAGETQVRLVSSEQKKERSVRIAAVDLGSTSFTLLIADVTRNGSIRPVVREKVMLRLGAAIASKKQIPDEACEQALEVARELRDVLEQEKVEQIHPVATAALRDARNGAKLADRIGGVLQKPVRILSGEEEARAMFRAFVARLELGDAPVIGLDLGGGSMEVAVGDRSGVMAECSTRLGVARLHRKFVESDPMKKSERVRIQEKVRSVLEPHRKALLAPDPERFIATGGCVRALARLIDERRATRTGPPTGPRELPIEALRELREELVGSNQEARLRMRGIARRRADLLPTAALILEEAAAVLRAPSVTVCDWGLREGVLLEAVQG